MSRHSSKPQTKSLRKFGFFVSVTLVITFIGFFVTMWLFGLFSNSMARTDNWVLLDGFVGVLTLSFLVGGLVTTVIDRINADAIESREKAKLSYEIYRSINDRLTDPEQEAARRWIISNLSIRREAEDLSTWYERTQSRIMAQETGREGELPEGQQAVKKALNCLDYIGFIAKNYWDIEDDSLDWLSPPIAKVWSRIGPYVNEVRRLRNANDYYVFAEYIGNLCIQRRQARGQSDEQYAANTP